MPGAAVLGVEHTQWERGGPDMDAMIEALKTAYVNFPELTLAAAVLVQAFTDLKLMQSVGCRAVRKRSWARDALRYIKSERVDWEYSFVNLCGIFHLDPNRVRKAVWANGFDDSVFDGRVAGAGRHRYRMAAKR